MSSQYKQPDRIPPAQANRNEECVPWELIRQCVTLQMVMSVESKHIQPLTGVEKAFGQAFRKLRLRQKISQEKVSDVARCDRTTVSLIERGLVSPKLETIVRICKAIATRPSEVMKGMEQSRFYR
jgi:DNA-binding XRE family transcriptional regulator